MLWGTVDAVGEVCKHSGIVWGIHPQHGPDKGLLPQSRCCSQAVAAGNQQLQQLALSAQQAAASGDTSQLTSLRTSMSKLAAVQQGEMATSIATLSSGLADKYATIPNYDASEEVANFKDVSGMPAL